MRLALSLALASAACPACSDQSVVVGGLQEIASMKALPNPDLDLLFVIDNSPSMADKQLSLAASFPQMIDVLGQLDGGLPNLHIGVVTSDLGTTAADGTAGPPVGSPGNGGCAGAGDDGALQQLPAMTERFLADVANDDGTRTTNYTGELRDVFGELARVGAVGCGFEQHLAAMRRALANPVNAGFLRPGANLAVVILADEDDCSVLTPALFGPDSPELGALTSFRCFAKGVACAPDSTSLGPKTDCVPAASSPYVEDVAPFVDALLATKPDPRMLMVGAIVGDPEVVAVEERSQNGTASPALAHSCAYDGLEGPQVADPGVRIAAFLDAFPERAARSSICSADLTTPLAQLGETAKRMIGDPCLDTAGLADASAEQPGVQPACVVYDVRDTAPSVPEAVPACSDVPGGTCYELVADAVACPASADHLRLRVHRATTAPDDAWTHVRCQLASTP